jgi:hypothetical protein
VEFDMKKLLLVLIITQCFIGLAQAYTLNQGDSATVSFSTLPYIGTSSQDDLTRVWMNSPPTIIDSDGTQQVIPFLKAGDSFRIDFFENRSDTDPYVSYLISGPGSGFGFGFARGYTGPLFWEDLEGNFKISMLSGSMTLTSFYVDVISGGQEWAKTLDVTPTPIPAAFWLMGSGLAALALSQNRKRNY